VNRPVIVNGTPVHTNVFITLNKYRRLYSVRLHYFHYALQEEVKSCTWLSFFEGRKARQHLSQSRPSSAPRQGSLEVSRHGLVDVIVSDPHIAAHPQQHLLVLGGYSFVVCGSNICALAGLGIRTYLATQLQVNSTSKLTSIYQIYSITSSLPCLAHDGNSKKWSVLSSYIEQITRTRL
jgi:hypothetical protein